MADQIVISGPKRDHHRDKFRVSAFVRVGNTEPRALWFDLDPEFEHFAGETLDPFLLCLLPAAIEGGRELVIDGPLSPLLHYNANANIIPVLSEYFGAPRTKVEASELRTPVNRHGAVITGFSGGVDSFSTFFDHGGNMTPAEVRITHLLLSNAGHHGPRTDDALRVYKMRLDTLRRFGDGVGLPIISVDSNLGDFIAGPFQKTHTLRNAAVALLLQQGAKTFLYSSAYPYHETKMKPSNDMAYIDPVLLPMLGTEAIRCIPTGAQHTRVEKTAAVANVPAARQFLDVCTRTYLATEGRPNCGICWKCMRTQATLDLLGVLPEFAGVFPIDLYTRHKKLYFVEVMGSRDPLTREIRDLVKQTKAKVSFRTRVAATTLPRQFTDNVSRAFPKIRKMPAITATANRLL